MDTDEVPFNKQLRLVTRDVHSISDTLVNAKLALALPHSRVWAEGLLVFYEIFRYLEIAMDKYKTSCLGKMFIEGMARTEAFEKDLAFYFGKNWKENYTIRPEVADYLSHLQNIEKEDPDILIAYVYHLYMGLLSGGQILKKRVQLGRKLVFFSSKGSADGYSVTDYEGKSVYNLKKEIVKNVNSIANDLNENVKDRILEESRNVFLFNNQIINSVEGVGTVLIEKTFYLLVFFIFIISMYYFLF